MEKIGLDTVKVVKEQGEDWLYWGEYNLIFKYSKELEKRISEIQCGRSNDCGIEQSSDTLINTINEIAMRKAERQNRLTISKKDEWEGERKLRGALLEVSNDCNLRCIYCYGQGGSYGSSRQLMKEEVLIKSLEYCFQRFESNQNISIIFFGGEPLINYQLIIKAVDMINEFAEHNGNTVSYGITTNGTILNDDIVKLFKRNKFKVTVSIDGGEIIQNKNRPFPHGDGSFGLIKRNVNVMLQNNISLIARITLTKPYIKDLKKSVEDIWEMGINNVTFETVSSTESELNLTEDDLVEFQHQLQSLTDITYNNIKNKGQRRLRKIIDYARDIHTVKLGQTCSYNSQRAVVISSCGELYRCHRLLERQGFCVGDVINGIKWEKYISDGNLERDCKSCWAKNICTRCAHENYIYTGELEKPDPFHCELKKAVMEEAIKLYIKLKMAEDIDIESVLK